MSKMTVVCITNESLVIDSLANEPAVITVKQEDRILKNFSKSLEIPEKQFLLRKCINSEISDWLNVINWLEGLTENIVLLAIDYDHPLRELVLLANKYADLEFGLIINSNITRILPIEYALLNSAFGLFFTNNEYEETLKNIYVGPSQAYPASIDGIEAFAGRKQAKASTKKVKPISMEGAKNVLLISYFSGPCQTVGVQRVNYWAEEIEYLSQGNINVHVASAIDWTCENAKVHYVPDLNIACLFDDDAYLLWAAEAFEAESKDAKNFSTLSYYWRYALEQYFDGLEIVFDAVIISGNPFSIFDFSAYAKRKWYAKVLLDYRDPFANNPRMKMSDTAREYARFKERGFNFPADALLTVNDMCTEFFEDVENKPKFVVANGYDERKLEKIKYEEILDKRTKFVHAGSFYYDRSPRALIENIDPDLHSFYHIGKTAGIDDDILETDGLICYGTKPYTEALSVVAGCDCGVVYVSKTGFETPTKLYEYLAFGLDVLICTHGPIKAGALFSILKDYPGIFWCENSDEGVQEFLKIYTPGKRSTVEKKKFSRKHSTKQLLSVLEQIL